jgi:beta-lactamase class A
MKLFVLAVLVAAGCDSSAPGIGNGGQGGSASQPDAPGLDASVDAEGAMCPAGTGSSWSCVGQARARCTAGTVETETCEFGCVPRTGGDAVCSCGSFASYTLWNCTSDGDLHKCDQGAWLTFSCGGRGCEVQPDGIADRCRLAPGAILQTTLDRLGAECGQFSPSTTCGLAVRDLATGETAGHQSDRVFESASEAKAVWVAAALDDRGVAAVEPYATPVFRDSDNTAASGVIDLLASPDRINTYMWNVAGMTHSGFCRWDGRYASNCPSTLGGYNFLTADDASDFMTRLWNGVLMSAAETDTQLAWMLLSPRSGGDGGWLGTQLPATARAGMHHKAGWYPPSSESNDIGVVEIDASHAYSVAIYMADGTDYDGRQLPMLEYASCVIYHAVARDLADPFQGCTHP